MRIDIEYGEGRDFGDKFLQEILEYIGDNFKPDRIYDLDELQEVVKKEQKKPEDLFTDDELKEWALENGFVEQD